MSRGPLQLMVLEFPEAELPSHVLSQLHRLQRNSVVRLVDTAFVVKDNDGELNEVRVSEPLADATSLSGVLTCALFGCEPVIQSGIDLNGETVSLAAEHGEFGITSRDIDEIADLIPRGRSAVLILLEHLWSDDFKDAVHQANGNVIAHGWITPATLRAMQDESLE